MEYYLEAVSSNCGQLGPNFAIPTPKFDHPILLTLNIAVYGHNRVVFNYLSVIENPDPSGPQYTLLLTEDQGQLKGLVMKSISILMTHLLIMIYPTRIIPCLMNNMLVKMVQIC